MDIIAELFLKVLSMGITASVVIAFVLLIRVSIMRSFPKRYTYLLWIIVGVRLVCPITISSSVSVFNLWQYIQKAPFVQEIFFDMAVSDEGKDLSSGSNLYISVGNTLSGEENQPPAGKTGELTDTVNQPSAGKTGELSDIASQPLAGKTGEQPVAKNQSVEGRTGRLQDDSSVSDNGGGTSDKASHAFPDSNNTTEGNDDAVIDDGDGQNNRKAESIKYMSVEEFLSKYVTDKALGILAVIWVLGIIVILLWNLFLYARMRQKTCKAVLYHDNIFECDGISSPFVMGLINPCIYIPFRLGEKEREYILKHEWYHIKRHDYIVNFISFLITLVYWFNPLVWISYFCMVRDMEMSCDEYVLAAIDTDIRKDYSRSLLAFATNRRRFRMNLPAFGETDTRRRVKNIMNFKKKGKLIGITSVVLLLAIGAMCMTNARAVKNDNNITAERETDNKSNREDNNRNNDKKNDDKEINDDEDKKTKINSDEIIIAEKQINGWQVQLILKKGEKKQIIVENSPKSSYTDAYEGVFYLRSCKDGKVLDKCVLTFFDGEKKLVFPEELLLNLADYDGDKNVDDFSLGQLNASSEMEYQFYTVDGDGSIVQYKLVTDNATTDSVATKSEVLLADGNNDYSKIFDVDSEGIKYKAVAKKGSEEREVTVSVERIVYLTGDMGESDESDMQRALHKAVNATMPKDITIEAETGVWHEVKYGANETGYLLADSDTYNDITMRLDFTFYNETLIRYVSKDYGFVERMAKTSIGKKEAVLLVQKFAKEFVGEKFATKDISVFKLPALYSDKEFAAFTDTKGNSYVVHLNRNMVVEFDAGETSMGFVIDKQEDIKEREKAEDEERNKDNKTVQLLYYEPNSLSGIPEYYIPESTEQEKFQKLAGKLNVSYVCSEKDMKQFYKEKELGYSIKYAGNVWEVYSGGYVCLRYGKDFNIDNDREVVINYPSLCKLAGKVLKENIDYTSVTPEEIKDITSATLVYFEDERNHERQEITGKQSLRILEKLLSFGKYLRGGSNCPMGEAILTLRRNGKKDIFVTLATDDCAVFRINGVNYDYGSTKNSEKLKKIFDKIKWRGL